MTLPALTSTVINVRYKGFAPITQMIYGIPSKVTFNKNNNCKNVVENCAPYDVTLEYGDLQGLIAIEEEDLIPLTDDAMSSVCNDIHQRFPKMKKKTWSRNKISQKCHLQVPDEFKDRYINLSHKNQEAISLSKYNLGLAKDFTHKIHLKNKISSTVNNSKFQKPTTNQFIEQMMDKWLKLGVVERSNSFST
jgi:hypothetical protein